MEKPKIRFLKNKHSWVRNTFEEIAKRRTKSSDNPDLPRIEYQDIISGEGRLNKDLNKNIDYRKGIVFETNDVYEAWNCTYKGKFVEQGVYTWYASYHHLDTPDRLMQKTGAFMVYN
mgnify:CR=1 FL=1